MSEKMAEEEMLLLRLDAMEARAKQLAGKAGAMTAGEECILDRLLESIPVIVQMVRERLATND